jgi:hypothetical protein
MPESSALPDRLGRTSEARGDEIWYRFAHGLVIRAERLQKDDPLRVLPLGSPQAALLNHMVNFPELVRGKRVFEPFAGSGPLGLMALALGAEHVDFLDINPRACAFQRQNAAQSGLAPERFRVIEGDVARFLPERRYDVLVANPPFVPTPEGLDGTLTSNGGADGNRFAQILIARLDLLLEPNGEALIYLFQVVRDGTPLVAEVIARARLGRPVDLTPAQARPIPFDAFRAAYARLFPEATREIERWEADLVARWGRPLALCHYVVHVRPRAEGAPACVVRDDFAQKFGPSFLVPSEDADALALARASENLVGPRSG